MPSASVSTVLPSIQEVLAVASDRVTGLNRGAMHLLSSPPLDDHNCGGFSNLIAWLLNGLIADTVEANPNAGVECFIFAQRLPADTLAGIKKDAELVSRTASHYTGCMVRELPTSLNLVDRIAPRVWTLLSKSAGSFGHRITSRMGWSTPNACR